MKDANLAPIYCGMYPQLAEITRKHGYALAVHGSLARDFDFVCVPWVETPSKPEEVIAEIVATFTLKVVGEPDITHHGRERWAVSISYGECFMDISFFI